MSALLYVYVSCIDMREEEHILSLMNNRKYCSFLPSRLRQHHFREESDRLFYNHMWLYKCDAMLWVVDTSILGIPCQERNNELDWAIAGNIPIVYSLKDLDNLYGKLYPSYVHESKRML